METQIGFCRLGMWRAQQKNNGTSNPASNSEIGPFILSTYIPGAFPAVVPSLEFRVSERVYMLRSFNRMLGQQ